MAFGDSPYIQSQKPEVLAAAEFYDFAPAPCSCFGCLCPSEVRGRTFIHVHDNRFTANMPVAPFCCCTQSEKCIVDRTMLSFYDRMPVRTGMCCFVIPMTCCGPPVIFVKKPFCCCVIDMTEYFGESIMASPSSWCNLKKYLCFGGPCYSQCAIPMFGGVKNGSKMLHTWDKAVRDYGKMTGIDDGELAIFQVVKDSEFDIHGAQTVGAPQQNGMKNGRE